MPTRPLRLLEVLVWCVKSGRTRLFVLACSGLQRIPRTARKDTLEPAAFSAKAHLFMKSPNTLESSIEFRDGFIVPPVCVRIVQHPRQVRYRGGAEEQNALPNCELRMAAERLTQTCVWLAVFKGSALDSRWGVSPNCRIGDHAGVDRFGQLRQQRNELHESRGRVARVAWLFRSRALLQ